MQGIAETPDALPVALVVTRPAGGTVLYANRLFGTLLGVAADSVLGRGLDEVLAEPGAHHAIIAAGTPRGGTPARPPPLRCWRSFRRRTRGRSAASIGRGRS